MQRKKEENSLRLVLGLVLIAAALNVFSCKWSRTYQPTSPTAIAGVENLVGVYAKNDREQDTMLGIIVPAALVCMGAFFSREQ